MNKIFTLISFLIYSLSFSQNITLDELIILRKKDLAIVEEKLSLKGWSYTGGEKLESENLEKAIFAYNHNKSSYDDKAESFITYYSSNTSEKKRIYIQIIKKETYNIFLARIKALGCKLINSKISDGKIKKIYQGSSLTFIITIGRPSDEFSSNSTLYHFSIIDNSDYKYNFDETSIPVDEIVVEEDRPKINKEFFIGRWKNENSVFTFSSSGDLNEKFNDGTVEVSWWYFTYPDNISVSGDLREHKYNKLTIYKIINNGTNWFSYNTSINEKVVTVYRSE